MSDDWKDCDPNCRRCATLERVNRQKTELIRKLEEQLRQAQTYPAEPETLAASGGAR